MCSELLHLGVVVSLVRQPVTNSWREYQAIEICTLLLLLLLRLYRVYVFVSIWPCRWARSRTVMTSSFSSRLLPSVVATFYLFFSPCRTSFSIGQSRFVVSDLHSAVDSSKMIGQVPTHSKLSEKMKIEKRQTGLNRLIQSCIVNSWFTISMIGFCRCWSTLTRWEKKTLRNHQQMSAFFS